MKVNLTIGGDFCITPQYATTDLFSDEIIDLFRRSDINIVNLECPILIKHNTTGRIIKSGPNLYTDYSSIKQLNKININTVTLANNHILDFGADGLNSTVESCSNNGIQTVGAGRNLQEANKPIYIHKNGIRVALVNFCENEFSIATETNAGANPMDLISNLTQIKLARQNADFVIVIIHGGHEHYNLPSPRMIKQYRFFAENGADIVIGHHSHCISGIETHKQVPIFYGLGNMIFTLNENKESWYYGLLLQLEIIKNSPITWNLVPITQAKENFTLSIPKPEVKEEIKKEVKYYSDIISDLDETNRHWKKFIDEKEMQYINVFSPINGVPNRFLRAILRRLGFNKMLLNKRFVTQVINYINCESHIDLSREILQKQINK